MGAFGGEKEREKCNFINLKNKTKQEKHVAYIFVLYVIPNIRDIYIYIYMYMYIYMYICNFIYMCVYFYIPFYSHPDLILFKH